MAAVFRTAALPVGVAVGKVGDPVVTVPFEDGAGMMEVVVVMLVGGGTTTTTEVMVEATEASVVVLVSAASVVEAVSVGAAELLDPPRAVPVGMVKLTPALWQRLAAAASVAAIWSAGQAL